MIWTKNYSVFTIILINLFCFSATAHAVVNIGTFGATYKIAEQDNLKEIKEIAGQVDWNKYFNPDNIESLLSNYKPDLIKLPQAQRNQVRLIDMSYTLDMDIPDGKGGILYPRGYTFNPLDYSAFTKTMIVFDGTDPEQIKWAEKYIKSVYIIPLITDGSCYDLSAKLQRPIFYATVDIIQRFQIQKVPSIIKQNGKYMEIREIEIQKIATHRFNHQSSQ